MPENTAKQRYSRNWRNVIQRVATVTHFEAGVACVDLDSVLLQHDPQDGFHLGRVLLPGVELVRAFKRRKFQVVVLTARTRNLSKICMYLVSNGVLVDRVTNRKPYADVYVDDKAFRVPKNWL